MLGLGVIATFESTALAQPLDEAAPAEPAPPEAEPAPPEAEPAPPALAPEEPAPLRLRAIHLHGFISQGGFFSTSNDYIGASSRGSLAMFEAGLNVSTEVTDRLRAGLQLFARNVGTFRDIPPRLDWAFLDYRWKRWLGLRAGIVKLPYGLHNEYADIDAARLSILLPQSVYPLRNRSALISHTGFALYGERTLGTAGSLEYQALLGTLDIPENALNIVGARLDEIDTKYVTGAQLFWRPPVEGLRIGASYVRTSVDFHLTLDASTVAALIMAGLVPADFDGALGIYQRPTGFVIGSAEYSPGSWLFAAEYGRWSKRQRTTLPMLLPTFEEDSERFYVMANRRWSERVAAGVYYSVFHVDAADRRGRDETKYAEPHHAFQRDLAATVRYDVNEHWLWKLEAHFIDGTADLFQSRNPQPERYWGLFLFKTTVTF